LTENTEHENQQTKQRRLEFNFPMLIVRTEKFSGVFEKLGKLKFSKFISWIFLLLVPFVAGIALYLFINSLIGIISMPMAGELIRELGPGVILMLPGLNPILPIVYGWVGIICAIVIHEGAHGIIARNVNLDVKSSGLLFFLFIPIGAFVDVDEEQIKKAKPRSSLKVMAAGVGGNILVGVICLLGVLVLVGGLSPVVEGVYINDVTDGMPAQVAGLLPEDVIISLDQVKVNDINELKAILDNKTAGDQIQVTVARGERWQNQISMTVNLTSSENRTVMGISVADLILEERLQEYRTFSLDRLAIYIVPPTLASGLTPFSDALTPFYTHSIPYWSILANCLFWIWFVNFNLAIFNALPIYPLDGWRIFQISLKKVAGKKMSERKVYLTTVGVTIACVTLVVLVTALPFVL